MLMIDRCKVSVTELVIVDDSVDDSCNGAVTVDDRVDDRFRDNCDELSLFPTPGWEVFAVARGRERGAALPAVLFPTVSLPHCNIIPTALNTGRKWFIDIQN